MNLSNEIMFPKETLLDSSHCSQMKKSLHINKQSLSQAIEVCDVWSSPLGWTAEVNALLSCSYGIHSDLQNSHRPRTALGVTCRLLPRHAGPFLLTSVTSPSRWPAAPATSSNTPAPSHGVISALAASA